MLPQEKQIDHTGRMMVIWNFIEEWIQRNAPDLMQKIRSGATEQQVQEVEGMLGIGFPEDIRAAWLLHNGTTNHFFSGWQMLSMQEMAQQCQGLRKDSMWPIAWIPLASNGCGDYICIDIDQGEQAGRIMLFVHDGDNGEIAPSFWILMSTFVNDLEDDEYEINEHGELEGEEISFTR